MDDEPRPIRSCNLEPMVYRTSGPIRPTHVRYLERVLARYRVVVRVEDARDVILDGIRSSDDARAAWTTLVAVLTSLGILSRLRPRSEAPSIAR